jgi:hypothetical protein
MVNEGGANSILEPWLLFGGEQSASKSGIPGIVSHSNLNFATEYLPKAPHTRVPADLDVLTRPQPDTAIGYLTPVIAYTKDPPLYTAFSLEHQGILDT